MTFGHRIEAGVAAVALGALDGLSWPAALRAGAALGDAVGALGLRRRVARENLALAFPGRTPEERDDILARHYREVGRIAAEYGRMARMAKAPDGEFFTIASGADVVRSLAGRGAILVSGHYGHFEFGAACLAHYNPVDFVVKPLSNPAVDERITRLRRDAGVGTISTRGGIKEVLRALRAGRWVAIAADQDAGRHGVFVPFFGKLASTAEGAARLGLQARVPLLVGFMRRGADGRHVLRVHPAREADGPADEANVTAVTAWHTSLLEASVRESPEHYFWLHRRWKTRPPGERGGGTR